MERVKAIFAQTVEQELKQKKCIIKRCIRLPALTAERNVKFRSSQTAPGQSIAENVTLNEDHHEDSKLTSYNLTLVF